MSRSREFTELDPAERRIAMMKVAGAHPAVIAQLLEMNNEYVDNVLQRPRVARFVLLLTGVVCEGLEDGIKDMNHAFKASSSRAFELEKQAMEDLNDIGDDPDTEVKTKVRAKMGVVFTAKDILDRAGHRAPTKVYNYGSNEIPPEAAEALTEAARELAKLRVADRAIDITPQSEVGRGGGDGES